MLKTLYSTSHWQEAWGYPFWNWWRGVGSRDGPWSTCSAKQCTWGWGLHGQGMCRSFEVLWFGDLGFLTAHGEVFASVHKHCQWWDPPPCPASCGNEFRTSWILRLLWSVAFWFSVALSVRRGKDTRFQWVLPTFQTLWWHDAFQSFNTSWRFY